MGPQGFSSTQLQSDDNTATLGAELAATLKAQSFVRPERIREMLAATLTDVTTAGALLQAALRAYIDNAIARTILMKPVQLEADALRRKVQCVVASCVDAGSARREIEAALRECHTATLGVLQA